MTTDRPPASDDDGASVHGTVRVQVTDEPASVTASRQLADEARAGRRQVRRRLPERRLGEDRGHRVPRGREVGR